MTDSPADPGSGTLKRLLEHAQIRLQRRWPTTMFRAFERKIQQADPDGHTSFLKSAHVVLSQDVDAGTQLVSLVVEQFGSVGEHLALAAECGTYAGLGAKLIIQSGSAFDPHAQHVSSEDIVTSRILHVFTDRLAVGAAEIQAAFAKTEYRPIIWDDAYWAAHDEGAIDVFVCHDSADKERFVRPLAQAMSRKLVRVWYDENTLRPGQSLVESIELGLQRARYAVLVVSKAFLANKRWAAREFRSLITRDTAEERRMIIPIWLGVDRAEVAHYSLDLADRVAVVVSETATPEDVATQLIATLQLNLPDLKRRFPTPAAPRSP